VYYFFDDLQHSEFKFLRCGKALSANKKRRKYWQIKPSGGMDAVPVTGKPEASHGWARSVFYLPILSSRPPKKVGTSNIDYH
jgi:hypothetical protein